MHRVLALALGIGALAVPSTRAIAADVTRVVVEPGPGTIVTVEAIPRRNPDEDCAARQPRPLRAKYRGRLDLRLASDGTIRIINRLSPTRYLSGLAEVPGSWPKAALRAQAIAARSYAFDSIDRAPRGRSYDICATDACQVYRGAVVELGAFGERWVEAVKETEGRVLRYRNDVIQAFYFSTSTGRTRSSFPGGTPQPWLPSVDGKDEDSPLARWRVRVPLRDLAVILRARGVWPDRSIESVSQDGSRVTVRGGGERRTLTRDELRLALNNQAACSFPGRYPTVNSATGRPLPQTVPSATYRVERDGGAVVLRGRGWGHGVGMSQYGARALAERGSSTTEILDHFYGAASIRRFSEPGSIRVLAAERMTEVRFSIRGSARVSAGGDRARVGKRFAVRVRDDSLEIRDGKGPSLPPTLTVTPDRGRAAGVAGERAVIRATLSRAARLTVRLTDADGRKVRTEPERSYEIGAQRVRVRLRGDDGEPLAAGRYRAVVEAYDGYDRVRAKAVTIAVEPAPSPRALPTPPAPPAPRARGEGRGGLIAAGAAATLLALGGWLALRRRGLGLRRPTRT